MRRDYRLCSGGACNGLSRMSGNVHVRFLGEEEAVTPPPYPTGTAAKWQNGAHAFFD
jgi:hypothetical protein